jgi:hypothetical protein
MNTHIHLSRRAGTPLYGKRTERVKISLAPLTKELAHKEAQRLNLTLPEFIDQVIAARVHGIDHVVHDISRRVLAVAGNGVNK